MNVRDVMTAEVLTVRLDTPLKKVARLLIDRRISGVPVLDGNGHLAGVLSEADFVLKEAGAGADRLSPLRWLVGRSKKMRKASARLHAVTAGEAMSSPPVTIGPDRPLPEAAALMARAGINRLPVVDGDRLVGIITRADVVRAYARTDAELLDVVRQAVRAVDGLRVADVRDGIAVLSGTVAHQVLAESVCNLVQAIDGIVGVDDEGLAWIEPPVATS